MTPADLTATLSSTSVTQGTPVSVTVTDGGNTVTATTYQWQGNHGAGFVNLAGETSLSHAVSEADEGATLRIVGKAQSGGLIEGRRLTKAVGLPGPHRGTQRSVRALLTGYLLATLGGDKTYRAFADPDAHLPKTNLVDPEAPPVAPEEKIVALLK